MKNQIKVTRSETKYLCINENDNSVAAGVGLTKVAESKYLGNRHYGEVNRLEPRLHS